MPGVHPDPDTFADGVEKPDWKEIAKYPNEIHGSNLDQMMSINSDHFIKAREQRKKN